MRLRHVDRLAAGVSPERLAEVFRQVGEARVLKRTRKKTVFWVPGEPAVVVSRYDRPGGLRARLRFDRARRAFRAAEALRRLGVPVAEPLFAVRRGERSYFGAAFVSPGRNLDAALRRGADLAVALRDLARAIASAHAAGRRLRDLRAENLLVDADGRIHLVDLDGVGLSRGLADDARDLARLSASFPPGGPVSDRDRLRFLTHYFRARRALARPVRRPRTFAARAARRAEALWSLWKRRGLEVGAEGVRRPVAAS